MRRAAWGAAVAAAAALAAAGCGGAPEREAEGAAPGAQRGMRVEAGALTLPRRAPLRVSAAVAERLRAGAVAVAGVDRRARIAPTTLRVNSEQTLRGLRWKGWGASGATARGGVVTLICDPSCAGGRIERSSGRVVLGGIVRCRSRRFYSRARLSLAGDPDRRPAAYLSTPCREGS
jgi:hypothetical protein